MRNVVSIRVCSCYYETCTCVAYCLNIVDCRIIARVRRWWCFGVPKPKNFNADPSVRPRACISLFNFRYLKFADLSNLISFLSYCQIGPRLKTQFLLETANSYLTVVSLLLVSLSYKNEQLMVCDAQLAMT